MTTPRPRRFPEPPITGSSDPTPPPAPKRVRCDLCGYDLRASPTGQCPECGAERTHAVPIAVPADFHCAKLALEDRGLLINAIQPGGSLGTQHVLWGFQQPGQLIVRLRELELVADVLDEFDIPHLIHQRPIVDRSEPVCPKCRAPLDPQGEEICPSCHAPFTWIETENPEIDPTGRPCKRCNYDLTGNTTDRCPECGRRIEDDADTLVAAATGESLPWAPELVNPALPPSFMLRSRAGILIVMGVALAAFTLIVIVLDLDADGTDILLGTCWLSYVVIALAVGLYPRATPRA